MPIHVINAFGELMYDRNIESSQILTSSEYSEVATDEPNWVKLLELFLFHSDYRNHDTSKYKSSHLGDAKRFVELQEALNACSAAVHLCVDEE